jgi:hypothetical protein
MESTLAVATGLLIASVTFGCGRSDLLADDEPLPVAEDARDATTGHDDARGDGGAARDGEPLEGSFDAPSGDSSVSISTGDAGDADAAPAQRHDAGCGPDTCDGCCREDDVCVHDGTQTPTFCGSGGLGCIMCPAGIACGIDTADGTRVCAHFL